MKLLYLVTILLLLQSCNQPGKQSISGPAMGVIDTTFLKTTHWDSLNEFVSYHILQNGSKAKDNNYHFSLQAISSYQYFNHTFIAESQDTPVFCQLNDLKKIILSDSFGQRESFDCLLKINSKIAYAMKPAFLRRLFVIARDTSYRRIKSMISDLKKGKYAMDITPEVTSGNVMGTLIRTMNKPSGTTIITIRLYPQFWDVKRIMLICDELKQRPDIEDAFFIDFYAGRNETDIYYRLKTEKNNPQ